MPICASVALNDRHAVTCSGPGFGESKSHLEKSGLLLEKRNFIMLASKQQGMRPLALCLPLAGWRWQMWLTIALTGVSSLQWEAMPRDCHCHCLCLTLRIGDKSSWVKVQDDLRVPALLLWPQTTSSATVIHWCPWFIHILSFTSFTSGFTTYPPNYVKASL